MYRIAVVQNQSESLRAGYADVARNLKSQLQLTDYEFDAFDGADIHALFGSTSERRLDVFDVLFVSTNAASDEATRKALEQNRSAVDTFLRAGKGLYLGYQKKLSLAFDDRKTVAPLLPEPYNVSMRNRPKSEPDSGTGQIFCAPHSGPAVGSFLLLNSPGEVTEELIMTHCRENDFKTHVYRATLVPDNEAAFETVLEDRSFGDTRRLMLVNRSSLFGERVVVSTVAVDWEGHRRLLENILRYLAEGIPRVGLIAFGQSSDPGFDFIRSTGKLLRVSSRQYDSLDVPDNFAAIHDVYVTSALWPPDRVETFWKKVAGPKPKTVQPASAFKRLYHLGDPGRGCTSLTRYVNYTSIDVLMNEALLWLEQRFNGGFWAGGFWNSHDVLQMFVGLNLDASTYASGVLRDIEPHLLVGGYDAVMGPSCGLLSLLNRLSVRYNSILTAAGFNLAKRADIACWILDNLEGQSDIARQVAARALFDKGGEDVLDAARDRGKGDAITALSVSVRKSLGIAGQRTATMSEMDLVRVVQLTHAEPALETVLAASLAELVSRQEASGLWGSIGRTASILTGILELGSTSAAVHGNRKWNEVVSRAVEALRAGYDRELSSWGGIIQDTAMSVHALGLYRSHFDVESQELFETVEADSRLTLRAPSVGRARIDLAELFARDLKREGHLRDLAGDLADVRTEARSAAAGISVARRKAAIFQVFGGISCLLLISLIATFLFSDRTALWNVVASTGSLMGLVVGAILAIPITVLLSPRLVRKGAAAEKGKDDE
jgi:hypothetical protein